MNSRLLLARLRGAFVGSFSGAAGLAGHGLGGSPVEVSSGSLLLLVSACAIPGVIVSGRQGRERRIGALVGLLLAGQALGHMMLTLGHVHGAAHALVPSPLMTAGHLVAALVAAALLISAERYVPAAFGFVIELLAGWLVPRWTAALELGVPVTVSARSERNARALRRACGGTRAPPVGVEQLL